MDVVTRYNLLIEAYWIAYTHYITIASTKMPEFKDPKFNTDDYCIKQEQSKAIDYFKSIQKNNNEF